MLKSCWSVFLLFMLFVGQCFDGSFLLLGKNMSFYGSEFSIESMKTANLDSVVLKRKMGQDSYEIESSITPIPQFNSSSQVLLSDVVYGSLTIDRSVNPTLKEKKSSVYSVIVSDLEAFIEYLSGRSFKTEVIAIHKPTHALFVKCSGKDMRTIVNTFSGILYVGLRPLSPEAESSINYMDLSVNRVNAVHALYPELAGENIQVSIKEQFMDTTDLDLKGRYFSMGLESEIISQHANFMATMVAGAGNTYHLGKGAAPFASISSSDFTSIFPDDNNLLEAHEISIQNHSYGFGIDNRYSPETQAFDHQAYQLPELLHVFSAGNKGNDTSDGGEYAGIEGFANLSGSQKMTKNALVIGATDRFGLRDNRSSVGPTFDGRIKPDLMAYGQEGSSDAAALVSGASVLIQDAYLQANDELPPSSLVKAVLIAGANEYEEPISFKTGYGKLNVLNAVNILNTDQYTTGAVQKNAPSVFEVSMPENVAKLRVALCWTDMAGIAGADQALVNDLNIKITDPKDNEWLPWVLDHSPSVASLNQPPTRGNDSRNNVELITIDNPEAGTFTIQVTAETEMAIPQNFALAYFLEESDYFEWTFPKKTDICLTVEDLIFRWDSNLVGTGKVELKNIEGDWIELSKSAELSNSYFTWTTDQPYIRTQLRMTVGANSYVSDEFNVVREIALNVDFDCEDKFKLIWEKDDLAIGYELFELGGQALVLLEEVSDSTFIASKSIHEALNYAIRPIYNYESNYKSRTIDYTQQGVNCYYKSFVAELIDDSFVNNRLNLTSISDIERVDFFNRKDGNNNLLTSIGDELRSELEIKDANPLEGVNNYFVQIYLKDGAKVQTDTTSIYFTEENTLIVFPNPIAKNSFLSVLTGQAGATLQLLNMRGDLLFEEEVFFDFAQIPIADLAEGVYVLRLYQGSNNVSHAKLMVTD